MYSKVVGNELSNPRALMRSSIDTTSIRKALIGQASIGYPSVGKERRLVKYLDSSSRNRMRQFVK